MNKIEKALSNTIAGKKIVDRRGLEKLFSDHMRLVLDNYAYIEFTKDQAKRICNDLIDQIWNQ